MLVYTCRRKVWKLQPINNTVDAYQNNLNILN